MSLATSIDELRFNEDNNPEMRFVDSVDDLAGDDFQGSSKDLALFFDLVKSRPRSAERSEALRTWKRCNRVAHFDRRGRAIKGGVAFQQFDLRGADLHNILLGYVDLRGVRLDGANLSGVRMKGAWLDEASLVDAQLSNSFFYRGSFSGADLTGADLSGANLSECNLLGADFSRATLTGALIRDTQRSGWRLDDVRCAYVFWDPASATAYADGEFEDLYSESRVVEFEVGDKIDAVTMTSVPEMIRAFKQYRNTDLTLLGVENVNGVNRFKFTVADQGGADLSTIESCMRKVLQEVHGPPPQVTNHFHTTTIAGRVDQVIQAGVVQATDSAVEAGEQTMAKFVNNITGDVKQQNQADVIHNPVYQEAADGLSLTQEQAMQLYEDLGGAEPEKDGCTDAMKQEVRSALWGIIKDGAGALTGTVYATAKEFFPSTIKAFLP